MGISMLLMTHDISVVASFADYIAVMYGGRIMEYGTVENVFKYKRHPYTKGLINATPSIIGDMNDVKPIEGNPPNMLDLPSGCVFHNRCEFCQERCTEVEPEVVDFGDGGYGKCPLYVKENEDGK